MATSIQTLPPPTLKTDLPRKIDWIAYFFFFSFFYFSPGGVFPWGISLQGGRISNFRFIGLEHYVNALQAPEFWNAMTNTVYYVIGTVPLTMMLSLGVAY